MIFWIIRPSPPIFLIVITEEFTVSFNITCPKSIESGVTLNSGNIKPLLESDTSKIERFKLSVIRTNADFCPIDDGENDTENDILAF